MRGTGSGNNTGVKRPRVQHGFTLIEVMIVVVIVAVLAALAAPSFLDATLSSRLGSLANKFVASAHLARSEAIKRNSVVTICVSTNGESCATGNWEQGWIVMCPTDLSNPSAAGLCVAGGPDALVFHREQAMPTGFKGIEANAYNIMRFQPTGIGVRNAANSLTQFDLKICRLTPSVGSQERVVTISATGRPSVSTPATTSSCS